jgi:hypothetical protein
MNPELSAQAERLRTAAALLGIPLAITRIWQVGSVACFALSFDPRISLRELKSRQDDLSRLAYAPVTISQDPATAAVIAQMPATRRQRLIAGPNAPRLSGARIAIGRLTSGAGDAVLDFASPSHAHLLIVAATGGGKTEAIHTILYQLARQNRPSQIGFLLIDPAGNRIHQAWDQRAHLVRTTVRAQLDQAVEALEWAARLVQARNAARGAPSPRLIVVVDEMASLFMGGRAQAERAQLALQTIAQLGRAVGVHAVLATQYASREFLGSAFIRANLRARLVGRVDSAQASALATGRDGCDAHRLLGYGDFLLVDDVGVRRLQVALSRPDAVATLPASTPRSNLPGCALPPPAPAAQPPAAAPQPQALTPPPLESDLLEKMRALLAADPEASNRKIELALFGYTGGSATTTVKRLREQLCAA